MDLVGSSFKHLSILKGHNNNKNAFAYSGLQSRLAKENKYIITDDGYSSGHCISRRDVDFIEDFEHGFQSKIRSIIENCFGSQGLKSWGFFTSKNSESLEMQTLGNSLIYLIYLRN